MDSLAPFIHPRPHLTETEKVAYIDRWIALADEGVSKGWSEAMLLCCLRSAQRLANRVLNRGDRIGARRLIQSAKGRVRKAVERRPHYKQRSNPARSFSPKETT